MKRLVLVTLALVLVCSLLIIASCGGSSSTTTATTTAPVATTSQPVVSTTATTTAPAAGTPKYGGTMKVAGPPDPGGPFGWPADIIGAGSASAQPVLECLLHTNGKGEYIPWLAKSFTVADDRKSITFYLQPNVKFSDGTEFNADAVKFNFDAQIESKKVTWKSVEVIDNLTVRVNLNEFNNNIFDTISDSASGMIASPTAYKTNGREWADKNPVGTGPFIFESYQQNTRITYTRNPNYWIAGKPYLDKLEIHFIMDELTLKAAMQSGELDMMNISLGKQQKEMQDLGFKTLVLPMTTYCLIPDTANADSPFSKKAVREAVEYAIDKEAIAEGLGYGTWIAPYQLPPRNNGAWQADYAKARKYDLAKAKALLTEAGYPNGFDTTIYSAPAARQADAEAAIAANLNEAGIRAKINNIDQASWSTYQTDGWKNGLLVAAIAGYANYNGSLNYYFGRVSTQHKSWERTEEFETMLDKSMNSPTPDLSLIRACTDYITENALVIPTTESGLGFAYADYVKDGGFDARGMAIWWNMESVWLDK